MVSRDTAEKIKQDSMFKIANVNESSNSNK